MDPSPDHSRPSALLTLEAVSPNAVSILDPLEALISLDVSTTGRAISALLVRM
jgi:hypothetical protein